MFRRPIMVSASRLTMPIQLGQRLAGKANRMQTLDKPAEVQSPSVNTGDQQTKWIAGKFNGILAPYGLGIYNLFIAFGIHRHVAHKCASDFQAQLGHAIRQDDSLKAEVMKPNKNREIGFKLAPFKSNKLSMHNAAGLARVLQCVDSLFESGLLEARPQIDTIPIKKEFVEYLANCDVWASTQQWKD